MLQVLPLPMRIYLFILSAVLGACMGSFLNCIAWRIVHNESALKGRSHCDACGHALGLWDLVPVFSYLFRRGRCRWCGAKLSARYLWSEIISAAVFVSALWRWDLTPALIVYLLLASLLLAISFADLEATIIPDRFIVAAIVLRVIVILRSGDILHQLLFSALGGVCIAAGVLIVVLVFEKLTGKEAMGGGDIKLLFVTGLFLGWKNNLLCLVLGCLIGILFGLAVLRNDQTKDEPRVFPFGPSIAVGAWIALLWGDGIWQLYLDLF